MNPAKIAEKIKSGMLKAKDEAVTGSDEASPTCHPERSDSEVEGSSEASNG